MKKSHLNNNIQNKIQSSITENENIQKENIEPNQNQNQGPPPINDNKQSNPQNNIELQKKNTLNSEDIDHPKPLESDYYDEEKEDIREIFNRSKINKSNQKTKFKKIEKKNLDSDGLSRIFSEDIKNDKDLRHNNFYNSIDFKNYKNKRNNLIKEKEINYILESSIGKSFKYSNSKINTIKTSYDDKKKNKIHENTINENDKKKDEPFKKLMNKAINNQTKNQLQINNNNTFTKINFNMNNKNISVINNYQLLKVNNQPITNKIKDQDSVNLRFNKNSKIYEEEIKHISNSQPKNINNDKIYKNITNNFSKPFQLLKQNINKNFNLYPRRITNNNSIDKSQKIPSKYLQNNRLQNNILQKNNKYYINGNNYSNKVEKKEIPFYAKSQKYLNISKTVLETENKAINSKENILVSTTNKAKGHNMVRDGVFNNVKTTNIFYSKKENPQKLIKVNRVSILDNNKNLNANSNDIYPNTPIKKNGLGNSFINSNQKYNIVSSGKNENLIKNLQINSPIRKNNISSKTVFNQNIDNPMNKSQVIIPIKKHFNNRSNLSDKINNEINLRNSDYNTNIKNTIFKSDQFNINKRPGKSPLNTYKNFGRLNNGK